MRGAALAGAMHVAQRNGVRFIGYGGTSAGAIIALLACVGYTGEEIGNLLIEKEFSEFIADGGKALEEAKKKLTNLTEKQNFLGRIKAAAAMQGTLDLFKKLTKFYGLSDSAPMRDFLTKKVKEKVPEWKGKAVIEFEDLEKKKFPPLKIVASNITVRLPVVFDVENYRRQDVISAVIASATYPFAFQPMRVDKNFLVDGGLSSNLPVFLFEKDRSNRLPVFAFDLAPVKQTTETKTFIEFCSGMIDTALGSGDLLMRETLGTIQYVSIDTGDKINTLDFKITKEQRKGLFRSGVAAANEYFDNRSPQVKTVAESVTAASKILQRLGARVNASRDIQAVHCPPYLIEHLLAQIKRELRPLVLPEEVRAAIWLPTRNGDLQVVYSAAMESRPDRDVAFRPGAGWIGMAVEQAKPTVADLVECPANDPFWGLRRDEAMRIGRKWKTVFSFPIFDPYEARLEYQQGIYAQGYHRCPQHRYLPPSEGPGRYSRNHPELGLDVGGCDGKNVGELNLWCTQVASNGKKNSTPSRSIRV